jgi:hypothetical protein
VYENSTNLISKSYKTSRSLVQRRGGIPEAIPRKETNVWVLADTPDGIVFVVSGSTSVASGSIFEALLLALRRSSIVSAVSSSSGWVDNATGTNKAVKVRMNIR